MSTRPWQVVLYDAPDGSPVVEAELEAIPKRERVRVARYIALLQAVGVSLGGDHVRHIRGKLFELRPDAWRVLYFAASGQTFVLLRCFRKRTERTPPAEIETAERRMNDYLERS
ncbi:MAG: type II toxin-antitoxin system RelE/ParE family toxin [Dehalococcoidia bacterium]|nr:type II toxin-antitoxin system RelE/ParE family toxin [Dehalococcoidia bacterium]